MGPPGHVIRPIGSSFLSVVTPPFLLLKNQNCLNYAQFPDAGICMLKCMALSPISQEVGPYMVGHGFQYPLLGLILSLEIGSCQEASTNQQTDTN